VISLQLWLASEDCSNSRETTQSPDSARHVLAASVGGWLHKQFLLHEGLPEKITVPAVEATVVDADGIPVAGAEVVSHTRLSPMDLGPEQWIDWKDAVVWLRHSDSAKPQPVELPQSCRPKCPSARPIYGMICRTLSILLKCAPPPRVAPDAELQQVGRTDAGWEETLQWRCRCG